ncbi:hypothetical protein GH714_007895 [Hevea brasiliensis]|uniref:Uncharacterized protein n=1 Tax=Hevea brasiliensis TaxID=3981 RepID=A0A6A6KHV0_HEVBR|nr:hypothetical protein GH714_007895 [Hevea brasiliensis]
MGLDLDSSPHYMLPSKRAAGGEVVLEQEGPIRSATESVTKKARVDHVASAAATTESPTSTGNAKSTDNTTIVANNNNNHSSGNVESSIMTLGMGTRRTLMRIFTAVSLQCTAVRPCGGSLLPTSLYRVCKVSARKLALIYFAKNLILAGVKSVTLHDEGVVELWHLSSNFVFTEDDVGKNRALASVQKLQELNNAVVISTLTTELTKEQLSEFQAVVFTDISLEKAIEFDDYCHNHQPPIAFIKSEVRGLFGSVFCDFGPEFTVLDVDGEDPHTGIIASISNDKSALVACVDDERLEFQDGDLVVFSEVQGMSELNDGKPRKVLNFKPLRDALKDPGDFLLSDFSKFDRPPLLHLAFQALDKFILELGRFPLLVRGDAQKLISLVTSINDNSTDGRLEEINQKILRHFAFGARAVLNPMAAMFGGIVGQEVVKACSGKFHPLFQPLNSRYDAQISVFGSKLQKKLEDANVFMVGSGALGCEFLKNLALMGVSCHEKGKLTITDDDVIEKSNLSRQFLFRDWNIGQAKSTVAASAAALINPHLNIEALQNRASPETENVFDDPFWENLNVVINALDNVNARLYVDARCLYFQSLFWSREP